MIKSLLFFASVVIIALGIAASSFSSDDSDPRKGRLLERVNKYYETRKDGRTELSYTYYDSFFRAVVPRRAYEGNLIEITFHSILITKTDITENIAKVTVEVEYEISEGIILGKPIKAPLTKDAWVDDWAWIDGDWYKVFKVNVNNTYIPFFPSFPP